jgi:branched-chain amino acid aminotransferase
MVTTFELNGQQLMRLSETPTMNAASAALPAGAYTTFRTYARERVLRLGQHVRRLEESAQLLGMAGRLDEGDVRRGLAEVLRHTGYPESRFRLTFTPSHFYISIEPFTPYPQALYETGVACRTLTLRRNNPHAKSTAFIASAGDAYKALPTGVHEGLMVAADGAVLEGLSSNFFALLGGVLHSEQGRALQGVTQALVLEVARACAPEIGQSPVAVQVGDLPHLAECFISSVSREIMPVVKIDDLTIGGGTPGPLTQRLQQGLRELIDYAARSVFD